MRTARTSIVYIYIFFFFFRFVFCLFVCLFVFFFCLFLFCFVFFVCLFFSFDRACRLTPNYTNSTQWIVNENLPLFKLKGCSSLSNEIKMDYNSKEPQQKYRLGTVSIKFWGGGGG